MSERFNIEKFIIKSTKRMESRPKKKKAERHPWEESKQPSRDKVSDKITDDFLKWHWGEK